MLAGAYSCTVHCNVGHSIYMKGAKVLVIIKQSCNFANHNGAAKQKKAIITNIYNIPIFGVSMFGSRFTKNNR